MITSRGGKGLVFPKVCDQAACTHSTYCALLQAVSMRRIMQGVQSTMPAGHHTSLPLLCEVHTSMHICPQGGWEADETVEAAALRETVEEAGVRGTLEVCHPYLQPDVGLLFPSELYVA